MEIEMKTLNLLMMILLRKRKMEKRLQIAKWRILQLIITKLTNVSMKELINLVQKKQYLKTMKVENILELEVSMMKMLTVRFLLRKLKRNQRKRKLNFQPLSYFNQQVVKRTWQELMAVRRLVQSVDLALSMTKNVLREA